MGWGGDPIGGEDPIWGGVWEHMGWGGDPIRGGDPIWGGVGIL